MTAEYEITVRLGADTKSARQALDGLGRKKERAKQKQRSLGRSVRGALQAVAAFAPVVRMARIGRDDFDMYSESLTGETAYVEHGLAMATGYPRSRAAAREATKAAAAFVVGGLGYVPASVRDLYDYERRQAIREEKGVYTLRKDPRFHGPNLGNVLRSTARGYLGLIESSFSYWKRELGL